MIKEKKKIDLFNGRAKKNAIKKNIAQKNVDNLVNEISAKISKTKSKRKEGDAKYLKKS